MKSEDWDIVGHDWAVRLLQRELEQDELSHAYLFIGPPSVGKRTLALALVRSLLCLGEGECPCGDCRACQLIDSRTHPDLHQVEPGTESGRLGIDQIRELERQLSLTPGMGPYRAAILSDFHQATPEAANALLKTLEEPPPHVVIILLAPDADSLLPTIVSRCQIVPLRLLSIEQTQRALMERWGVEREQAELLAHLCGGRLGWAVRAAMDPSPLQRRAQRLEDLSRLLGASLVERFRYAADLAREEEEVPEVLDLWTGWWRDVMLVAAGAEGPLTNPDMGERLRQQARSLGPKRAAALAKATREAANLIDRNANLRLTLEVLVAFDLPQL